MWVMDRLLADHADLKKKYDTLLEAIKAGIKADKELKWDS